MDSTPPSLLLSLPRELRDDIYLLLAQQQHVFGSTPRNKDRSLRRLNKPLKAYIDSRIYLPVRAPSNLLGTCRQLREECLDTISHLASSSTYHHAAAAEEEVAISESKSACENPDLEESVERARDDGMVRITLEIGRLIRGNMGAVLPTRELPSPRFLSLLPMLSRVRRIKFVVWGGYDWWKGPQRRYIRPTTSTTTTTTTTGKSGPSSLVKRAPLLSSSSSADKTDKTDGIASTPKQQGKLILAAAAEDAKPDAVSVAVDALLVHLPHIEHVAIDALIYAGDYWNWDLAENRWEGLEAWLKTTVHAHDGSPVKKVHRRLIACEPMPPTRGVVFYHQLEEVQEQEQEETRGGAAGCSMIHVQQGHREVPEDFEDATAASDEEEPAFTRIN
ncbi:hypothetical protein K504DRAFT_529598 [Pleomassaria siparia CBS 279.74]|uniref:F-box domain-containing protein n=1 Tax=Pleomassaria siparia CBS 279.74 TaxID=1314801 RepID=A0A6G1KRI4_9PLEO|nr:hypothetical protein K504DRAFT_529598 [Pleomassaria siparia CBS 279.74]